MEDGYLFKAKRLDNGEWAEGYVVKYGFTGKERRYIVPSYASALYAFEIDEKTICQCTGLKDRSGKLIWENDIISYQRDNDDCLFPNKDTKKRLGKVFYKDFRTTFAIGMGKNGSGSINDDLWKYVQNGNRVEVVVNIFDNPELLESEE